MPNDRWIPNPMILASEYERGLHAGKYMSDEERTLVVEALRRYALVHPVVRELESHL